MSDANVIKIDRAGIECLFVPKDDWDKLVGLIRTMNKYHNFGDATYDVKERADMSEHEGSSWEHPDVVAYSNAHQELSKLIGGWE